MNVTCPSCLRENAYLEIVDVKGSHYTCPDCDYEWVDTSIKAEDDIGEDELKEYEECPNCSEGDNRWVYQCEDCEFVGCYDEVYENGCYHGDEEVEHCPNCGSPDRTLIGKVGAGTIEE